MAKQQPNQMGNLQKQAFKAKGKYFAKGRLSYVDKEGNARNALDGDPIDPCDADFELFVATNAITDASPNPTVTVHDDGAGDAGCDEL